MQENKEKNTKRNKIIGISIGIIAILCFVAVGTYAYWQLTKKQSGMNEVIAACIDLSFGNAGENTSIELLNEFPIDDQDAIDNYEGYDFYVENHCPEKVTFFIATEKLTPTASSIKNSSITLALTNNETEAFIKSEYSSLMNTDPVSGDANSAKIIKYDTLSGNQRKTYNLKMWINNSSDLEDTSKEFETRLFVTTGQGIVDPEYAKYSEGCFTINGLGTIIGYNIERNDLNGNPCIWSESKKNNSDYSDLRFVADLVLPATVAGIPVKKINQNSFVAVTEPVPGQKDYVVYVYEIDDNGSSSSLYVIPDKDDGFYEAYMQYAGFSSLEEASSTMGYSIEEIKALIDDELPSEYDGPYDSMYETTFNNMMGEDAPEVEFASIDLSNATNLEIIDDITFSSFISNDELIIPASVKRIGYDAFGKYTGAEQSLVIPDSVEIIDSYAFYNFVGDSLTLGNNVQRIGRNAFAGYKGIGTDLIIPNSVKYIEFSSFDYFIGNSLTLGNNVELVGNSAFHNFNGTSLTLGNNIKTFEENAFAKYVGTGTNLIIPNSVKTIGWSAFYAFNGSSLTLGNNVETIDGTAFSRYVGSGTNLIIPDSVKTIGPDSFTSFNGNSLTLGNNVETIDSSAFFWYQGTNQDLIIPNSVKTIGENAFNCFNGSSLKLSNQLELVGGYAFGYQGAININRTMSDWESAISSGDLVLGPNWKHANATLVGI